MASSAMMNLGVRALFANYAAMQATSHNIANAQVDGYSRQRAELATAAGQYTGSGFFGKGVDVATVTRAHDAFMTREAQASASLAAMDAARLDRLEGLESMLPLGENGLGHATTQFLAAWSDLASRPQDEATRQVVLARAQELASRFASTSERLDAAQVGVGEALRNDVTRLNELSARIASINGEIAYSSSTGHTPNDLLDERDRLVQQLSEIVQVTTIPAADGSLGVFMGGGQTLVLGGAAQKLAIAADPADPQRSMLGFLDSGGNIRQLPTASLGGGSIAGLLRFQDDDLRGARMLVGRLATVIATTVNDQQALGLDLGVPPGAGAPVFAVTPPRVLADDRNSGSGSVSLAIADASQLQAAEYVLSFDGPDWTLTAPDVAGFTPVAITAAQMAAGQTIAAIGITVGPAAGAPAAGDRFLLQPVTAGASSMQTVLADPRGLAAASPLVATRDAANTGTASVRSLTVVSPTVNPDLNAAIDFGAGGAYTWELRDRFTNALVASGVGTWTAGQPIALNGFELQLDGVPAAGDHFDVVKTSNVAQNNGNALAFAALRDAALVGRASDGSGGMTVTDAYADTIAQVGVKVQGARIGADISAQVAADARQAQSNFSGVNLDEEAARLIQYQQSYQAAAKVLQVAQSIFDTLLDAAHG